MNEHTLIALAGIGLLSSACQWIAWRLKLPAILFLLLTGIVVGPVTGWLNPAELFGNLLFPIVSLAVAVILFEGSLTLEFAEIRGLERVVRNLVTIGLVVTWVITALATRWLLGFSWDLAFLFGALVVVTGPTVIVPLLRSVRPTAKIANILRWEGIVIDPLGALLAVLVFEFIVSGRDSAAIGHTIGTFAQVLLIGLVVGGGAGYFLGVALRRFWLPEYLHNVVTLTLVFGVFAFSDALRGESGLLAVTVMGVWLANMRDVHVEDILNFKENLSVLLISGLFIILAARVEFEQFQAIGWGALGIFLVIQFVARPLKVLVSTLGSKLQWRERALLAWIAPRGIVAAAVSSLFALKLEETGSSDALLLVPLTFIVIIGTVVLQSATARWIATLLGVAEPEPKGLLVIGANPVARSLAKALTKEGFPTLLSDSNWDNIKTARMEGLSIYFGNAVSEHADQHLDLVGIGQLLALSHHAERNALAGMRYRGEFGKNAIYALRTSTEKATADKHAVSTHHRGYTLFGNEVTYAKLASLLSRGAEMRGTKLTENFDYNAFRQRYGSRAIPMFGINPKGRLSIAIADREFAPKPGWTVLSLVHSAAEGKEGADLAQQKTTGDRL